MVVQLFWLSGKRISADELTSMRAVRACLAVKLFGLPADREHSAKNWSEIER